MRSNNHLIHQEALDDESQNLFVYVWLLRTKQIPLAGVALWTIGLGAQSSVMKAAVAGIVGPEKRGSAYGVLNSAYGLAWFGGSALMGWLYDHSLMGLVVFSILAQLAAMPLLAVLM